MGGIRRWWWGLSPGDRRLTVLFLAIIVATLPGYLAGAVLLATRSAPPAPPARAAATTPTPTVSPTPLPSRTPTPAGSPSPTPTIEPQSLAEVVRRGLPSTVAIVVLIPPRTVSSGTGVAVAPNQVVTNAHVVAGAAQVRIGAPGGGVWDATVRGLDPRRDLALLDVPGANLVPATLGDSSALQVLEEVVALGYPFLDRFEDNAPTATRGVISKLFARINGQDYIQMDASLNPGNSGGPLFNRRGEVVGINVARLEGDAGRPAAGIAFAIPINEVKLRLPALASSPAPSPSARPTARPQGQPQSAVRRYYQALADGDLQGAYAVLSDDFRQHLPYAEFARTLADKRGWQLQAVRGGTEPRQPSAVEADVLVQTNGAATATLYRERWRVVWENDAWVLDERLSSAPVAPPASPTPVPSPTRPPPTPTVARSPTRPPAAATPRPSPPPSGAAGAASCRSAPGSLVPGREFDIVQATSRPLPSGDLQVEGVVRNNCDLPQAGVLHVQALDPRGQAVARAELPFGPLAPETSTPFQVVLPNARGVSRVQVTATPP
ncbi:MAG TPA: trypsin-like peptidase domain-containing protein [Chloroflexota bacterium]|nr:trypsin-like peptidase domain-containing protein [Chloroflexota bacterium]